MPNHLIEIALVFCLFLAFLGDILQSVSRVSASVLRLPDLATHLTTLSMLVNRFGGAIALVLIGYSIDTGIAAHQLIVTYLVTILFVGACYTLAAFRGNWILPATARFVRYYYHIDPPVDVRDIKLEVTKTARFDLTIIYLITISGFLLPSVLAAILPDYRATLLQSGFLLNSIATLYTALKIEKDIALDLISNDDDLKWRSLVTFLMSRAYACLIAAFGFGILFWVMR